MEIEEARDPAAFESLRQEWEGLVTRSSRATVYQTWEWNEAWWRSFRRGKRLRLLLVRDHGALVGIVPLYDSRHLGTPLRRLAFVGTGASDYLDAVCADEHAPGVCQAVLAHLGQARGYDLVDLQQLRPESWLREAVAGSPLASHDRRRMSLVPQEACPYVSLPGRWEEYTGRLGKKMRSNLSYYDRLIARTFDGAQARLAEAPDVPAGMDSLFDLHQRRWNARLLPGVLGSARTQAFHRLVAQRFQERGWLRLHMLRVQGSIAAALYCYRFRERYYYYLGGYDPTLSRYSLGTVLTAHAMRQAIAEGCAEFDFLRGEEPYKSRWLPEGRVNHRLLIARPRSLRSHAMLRLTRIERYVEHRAKALAERRGRSRAR